MNGLNGVRVLLLDDNPAEALPVLAAFSKQGVPIAYFDGKKQGLPRLKSRLCGVRLAILDMDLGEGGNDATIASTLVQKLSKILSPDNGPYAILAWTNRPELRDRVEEYIFKHDGLPNPMFTEMLTKAECRLPSGGFSLSRVAEKLQAALHSVGPLDCLQQWEGACFTAATGVANALSQLVGAKPASLAAWRDSWRTQILDLSRAIAEAKAEQQLTTDNCLPSFYAALNPLHADKMDGNITGLAAALSSYSPEIMKSTGRPDDSRKSQINTMLHLAFHDLDALAAGNIYVFSGKRRPSWLPKTEQLLEGFMQKSHLEQAATVASDSLPAVVEITAACDHAQKKIQVGRFLVGLILPAAHRKAVNPRVEFMKELGPFFLEKKVNIPGQYYMFFSSRQVLYLRLEQTRTLRATSRLRNQALADLQAWFAYQASRQGTMMLK